MTINALQLNSSTVVGGLGTQTYNITTTGLYTCSFKSFIPYLAIGSPAQTASAVAEIQNISTVADGSGGGAAGTLNNCFFKVFSAGNLQGFYVWYNINSAGTDPAVAGLTGIQVAAATSATANTIAANTRAAILANTAAASYFAVSGATNHVILSNIQVGACTAFTDSTSSTATNFTSATSTTGTYGTPAQSGLDVVISGGSGGTTVLARYGFPTPTQPLMGGSVTFQGTSGDTFQVVLSSQSTADAAPNAVVSIINLFQGSGQ